MDLDLFTAAEARDAGIQATSITNAEWMAAALAELRFFLESHSQFRMEQFRWWWESIKQPAPVSPHAWGALARIAVGRGWIEPIGYVKSTSVRTHRHPVALYRSRVGG